MNSKPKQIFIAGIPTAGKSYLANKLSECFQLKVIHLDDIKKGLLDDERYKKWVTFYLDQDEEKYLTEISSEQKWQNLINQSEGLWSAFNQEIEKHKNEECIVFDSVNLLPHLIQDKYPNSLKICLLGKSFEEVFERNKKDPRWGKTENLQELEAKDFFEIERPKYKQEAEKYGWLIFQSADEAFEYISDMF